MTDEVARASHEGSVTLGLIPAPDIPEKLAKQLASELPELLGIADRIYTVFEGQITDCIPVEQATPETLMRSMTSAKKKAQV